MVVGVSAGALNAAWLAANPHLEGMELLARVWRDTVPKILLPPTRLSMLLRLATGKDSLLTNQSLQRLIRHLSPNGTTFGAFTRPRLYVVAAHLPDGQPRIFGDDPADLLLDGLMASAAVPPLFPPWEINGERYVDGGICSDLPLQIAVERGADEIFALYNSHFPERDTSDVSAGMLAIGGQAVTALVHQTVKLEIQITRRTPHVTLHLLHLWQEQEKELSFWDFAHAETLLAAGRRAAENYLADNLGSAPPLIHRLRSLIKRWLDKLAPAKRSRKIAKPVNLFDNEKG